VRIEGALMAPRFDDSKVPGTTHLLERIDAHVSLFPPARLAILLENRDHRRPRVRPDVDVRDRIYGGIRGCLGLQRGSRNGECDDERK
jgi:hypothetical protein